MASRAPPKAPVRRVLTSTSTTVSPWRATRSTSPRPTRWLRSSTLSYPRCRSSRAAKSSPQRPSAARSSTGARRAGERHDAAWQTAGRSSTFTGAKRRRLRGRCDAPAFGHRAEAGAVQRRRSLGVQRLAVRRRAVALVPTEAVGRMLHAQASASARRERPWRTPRRRRRPGRWRRRGRWRLAALRVAAIVGKRKGVHDHVVGRRRQRVQRAQHGQARGCGDANAVDQPATRRRLRGRRWRWPCTRALQRRRSAALSCLESVRPQSKRRSS